MSQKPEDAPEACPGGPQSELAGKAAACEGCPSKGMCGSTPKGPDPDLDLIQEKLAKIKHTILVLSGKGGVGKSTFSAQLAWSLANKGFQVGLLDIDMCGPSIPRMMGMEGEPVHMSNIGWTPIWVEDNLCLMSIGFLLPEKDDAVIWRGPKKNGLIKQFLKDVAWGELDYLVIDSPPGTSDEHISIAQYLQMQAGHDGVVLLTTPQEVSLLDVRKEATFCRKVNIPVLGVVENMSGFVCPNCETVHEIFPSKTGGAAKMAEEMNLRLLGKLPLDPRLAKACDNGQSYQDVAPGAAGVVAFENVIGEIEKHINNLD